MRVITRALLIAGLSAAAWTAWQAADHTAAHADDHRPHIVRHVVDETGQLLGRGHHATGDAKHPDPPKDRTDSATDDKAPPTHQPDPPRQHRHHAPADNPLGKVVGQAADAVGEIVKHVPTPPAHPGHPDQGSTGDSTAGEQDPVDDTLITLPLPASTPTVAPSNADVGVDRLALAPLADRFNPAQIAGGPAPVPRCGQDDTATAGDDEPYVPPITDHGHRRRHRHRHRPATPHPSPCDPVNGSPAGAAVTAGGVHIGGGPYADLPPATVDPQLTASRANGGDHRGSGARARSIVPAPA